MILLLLVYSYGKHVTYNVVYTLRCVYSQYTCNPLKNYQHPGGFSGVLKTQPLCYEVHVHPQCHVELLSGQVYIVRIFTYVKDRILQYVYQRKSRYA